MNIRALISAVFRKEVLAMDAYKVANAQGFIKLDAMENPYNWPEEIKNQWLEHFKEVQLNRYPDPEAIKLVKTLRELNHLPEQFEILLGNGSDEIIQLLLMALPEGSTVLAPAPGFVMYKQISDCLGLNYIGVPVLAEGFDLDLPAMLEAIQEHQPLLLFLAYPNNPTSNLFSLDAMHAIIKAAPGIVVVDEAYGPFANTSFIDQLNQYDNLLIMRTVSKLGLAGLRLGYLMGLTAIIEQLNKIRLPYNINCLTQITADFALANSELFNRQTKIICEQRTYVFNELNKINGIVAYPSAANFILFRVPSNKATDIFLSIKSQGVLIKNMTTQGGLLTDCLRVTIGKPDENLAFLHALRTSLAELSV